MILSEYQIQSNRNAFNNQLNNYELGIFGLSGQFSVGILGSFQWEKINGLRLINLSPFLF